MTLKNKELLVISPHFQKFQRSQIASLSEGFAKSSVIVPQPWFPSALLNLPLVEVHLAFLKNAKSHCGEYRTKHRSIPVYCPSYPAIPIPWVRNRMPLWAAESCKKIINKKQITFDLMHCHRLDYAYAGVLLKQERGFPLVVTCHGSDVYEFPRQNRFNYQIAQRILRAVDFIIAVGSSDERELISLGYPRSRIRLIPNGFDNRIFKPVDQESAKAEVGLQDKENVILSVGSLLPIKGHIHLIRAIGHLLKQRSDFHLVLVGSGPLKSRLMQEVKKLRLGKYVSFIGSQPLTSIPSWMSASEFLVLPSNNEGFPTVIPEAFSCGKPVVSTNVGSVPDAVSDEDVGILVPPANPKQLSIALNQALDTDWDSDIIIRKSRKYTLQRISKSIISLYSQVLSEGRFG